MSQSTQSPSRPCRARWAAPTSMRLAWALSLSLLVPTAAHSQYVVVEGKGYTLCERVAKHLNRVTENGRAKRLWVRHVPEILTLRYPQRQSYLTRELLSFPGFERPPFEEIRLQDIRNLIELIGEVDGLTGKDLLELHYQSRSTYAQERLEGKTPEDVLNRTRPAGVRLYQELEVGSARAFRLAGGDTPSSQTVLQIESSGLSGEPVSRLYEVSNDLRVPRIGSALGGIRENKMLVKWRGNYYSVLHVVSGVEVQAQEIHVYPWVCRIDNIFRPLNS